MHIDTGIVARVRSWIDEECVIEPAARTGVLELYQAFKASNPETWFKVRGFVLAVKEIGLERAITHYRTAKARMFSGIRPK